MNTRIAIAAVVLLAAMLPTGPGHGADAPARPGLPTVPLSPGIVYSPPVRLGHTLSDRKKQLIRLFLNDTDLLLERSPLEQGVIIEAVNRRLVITSGNLALVRFPAPLPVGAILTAFRPGPVLTDPATGEAMGRLTYRLGILRVERMVPQGFLARVIDSHREMTSGDRLVRTRTVNLNYQLTNQTPIPFSGRVLRIQNDLEVAAANQVIIVGLGRRDRAIQGLTLNVVRAGDLVSDPEDEKADAIAMPPEIIGEATLFHIGEKASFALLGNTRRPVRRGDLITNR